MTVALSLLLALTAHANPWTEPDPDGDGIHSAFDACPYDAEDFDGYQDDDGCAEPTRVLFNFVDPDGNPLQPVAVVEGVGKLPERRLLHVGLHGGAHFLTAALDGYAPVTTQVMVPNRYRHTVEVVLLPL